MIFNISDLSEKIMWFLENGYVRVRVCVCVRVCVRVRVRVRV